MLVTVCCVICCRYDLHHNECPESSTGGEGVLDDLGYYGLGFQLGVPESKRREIASQFSSVPQQRKALINYFIDHDPVASWRAVIVALEWMEEKRVADELRHLAEPVTGRAGS